jgi:hypothetical protein
LRRPAIGGIERSPVPRHHGTRIEVSAVYDQGEGRASRRGRARDETGDLRPRGVDIEIDIIKIRYTPVGILDIYNARVGANPVIK